jgi:hypothetical protein
VAFIKDVTIPDGTQLSAGEVFTKTWRLQNRGTCTWTPDYMLVYTSGDQMGSTTAVRLPGNVAPGQTVDVSVTLTAPASAGYHISYWMLRNPSGALFGTGGKANEAFYVEIKTKVDLPHGTVTGALCYPSEFNPPMTLYLEKAGTNETIQFSIPENQNFFSVLLPNGSYYAYAWAPGYNLEGAYTDSSGLMKTFVVSGGQTTPNINLCDWSPYAGREYHSTRSGTVPGALCSHIIYNMKHGSPPTESRHTFKTCLRDRQTLRSYEFGDDGRAGHPLEKAVIQLRACIACHLVDLGTGQGLTPSSCSLSKDHRDFTLK